MLELAAAALAKIGTARFYAIGPRLEELHHLAALKARFIDHNPIPNEIAWSCEGNKNDLSFAFNDAIAAKSERADSIFLHR